MRHHQEEIVQTVQVSKFPLSAVVDDVAVGLLALLPGSGDGLGAHPEHRLDGGAAHDVDEVVEAHWAFSRRSSSGRMSWPSLASRSAIRWESRAQSCLVVERFGRIRTSVVAPVQGIRQPDDTHHRAPEPPPFLSTFH